MSCKTANYDLYTPSRMSPVNSWIQTFKTLVDNYLNKRLERAAAKKAARQLSRLDDRMLKDIGLIRADIERVSMSNTPETALTDLERQKARYDR